MKRRNTVRMLAAGLVVACIHPLAQGAAIEDVNAQARASFDALAAPGPDAFGLKAPALPAGAPVGRAQDRPSAPMPVGTVFRLKEPRTVLTGQTTTLRTADRSVECRIPVVSDAMDTRLEALRLVRSAAIGFRLYYEEGSSMIEFFAAGDQAFLDRRKDFLEQPARDMFERYSRMMRLGANTNSASGRLTFARAAVEIADAAQGVRMASFEFNKVKDDGSAAPGIVVRMDCVKHLRPVTAANIWTFPQYAVPQVSGLDGLFTVIAAPPQ